MISDFNHVVFFNVDKVHLLSHSEILGKVNVMSNIKMIIQLAWCNESELDLIHLVLSDNGKSIFQLFESRSWIS